MIFTSLKYFGISTSSPGLPEKHDTYQNQNPNFINMPYHGLMVNVKSVRRATLQSLKIETFSKRVKLKHKE